MPTPTEWLAPTEFDPTDPVGVLGRDYHIIGLSNGNFLVAFDSDDNIFGPSTGRDIIGRIYDAEGNVVRDWFQINVARTSDNEENFSIAATNDGGFVIAYIDNDISNPNESALIWQRHVSNGVMTASAVIDAEITADGQFLRPNVAVNQLTNETVITFQETVPGVFPLPTHQNIYSVTVSSNGTVSAQFNAADNSAGDESAPNVAILTNGNIVTAYLEDSSGVARTEFRVMTPGGSVIRTRTVDSGTHESPNVTALANGNFVISWVEKNPDSGDDRIGYQVFFSNGISATVALFLDFTYGIYEPSFLDAVALPDGDFVLGWSNSANGNLDLQRFNANGTIEGSKISIVSAPLEVSLDVTSDGRLLVAWTGWLGFEPALAIYDPRDAVIDAANFELGLPNFTETDVMTARLTDTTINGDGDDNTLLGQGGNDLLQGFGGDDTLIGGAGQNTLDGGTGADTMIGGPENDSFFVDNLNDVVVEEPNQGSDAIFAQIDLQLGPAQFPNVERFFLVDSATELEGSDDNDEFFANFNLDSVLIGNGGDDRLNGRNGNDTLIGGAGDDVLDGGLGDDNMAGGPGNDTYVIDSVLDVVTELGGEGTDSLNTTINLNPFGNRYANIEIFNLIGDARAIHTTNNNETISANQNIGSRIFAYGGDDTVFGRDFADRIYGGFGNDTIYGAGGNDLIDGQAGADAMFGGDGNDNFIVNDPGDTVTELAGEGIDYVRSFVDFTLGANIERLRLIGSASEGNGNELDNIIFTNGAATLRGFGGDDLMRGSQLADQIYGGADNDTINGLSGDDFIHGGSGNDEIKGSNGDDTLIGGLGIDTIFGGRDNDTIIGGGGKDTVRGDIGADIFGFADSDFAGLTDTTADRITDFDQAEGDLIDLSLVDAITGGGDNAFTFIADAAFSGTAGELRFEQSGGVTMVYMDTDGDMQADYAIALTGLITLTEADFVL